MTFAHLYDTSPNLSYRRRLLRQEQTKAEQVLWFELRDRRQGFKFKRQFSIGNFIVDFYCHELKCIIELDGPIHEEQEQYDRRRELWLKNKGYHILRFKNDEVLFERDKTMERIALYLQNLVSRRRTSP